MFRYILKQYLNIEANSEERTPSIKNSPRGLRFEFSPLHYKWNVTQGEFLSRVTQWF